MNERTTMERMSANDDAGHERHRPTATQQRLGRGLAALIGEIDALPPTAEEASRRADAKVPIASIRPNPRNPRGRFDEEELEDLAASMRAHGLIQPILVRPADGDTYEIVAGERRWRAAQMAQLDAVPIIVREVDDVQALELAIVENVQRADLDAIEEAKGYRQLIERHDYSQADLSRVIGKSRSHVANTMRLLKLPDDVQEMVTTGTLTSGHARALVVSDDPLPLARRIADEGLSVRAVERIMSNDAARERRTETPRDEPDPVADADRKALEARIAEALGMKVKLRARGEGGSLTIDFRSLEQLDELCLRLLGRDS